MRNQHTHCRRGHELTPDNTYTQPKSGKRECRICRHLCPSRMAEFDQAWVTCPDCGEARQVRKPTARKIRNGLYPGRCMSCASALRANGKPQPKIGVTQEDIEFWRSRFSQREIDVLWAGVSLYLDDPNPILEEAA